MIHGRELAAHYKKHPPYKNPFKPTKDEINKVYANDERGKDTVTLKVRKDVVLDIMNDKASFDDTLQIYEEGSIKQKDYV